MSEVKRFKPVINDKPYKPYAHCEESEDGIYVRLADYDELKAQRDALAAEIARRDEIFIPLYPDENLMNKLTDVFHDTAKLEFTEDDVYVGNPELVISALINNFLLHSGQAHTMTLAYLNSVRAEGVEIFAKHCDESSGFIEPEDETLYTLMEEQARNFAAQLRAGKDGE